MKRSIAALLGFCSLSVPAFADDCDDAIRLLERGAKHDDGSPEEEKAFREATQLCPKMGDAHYNLGLSLSKQRRFADAVPVLEKAVALGKEPAYLVALGNALFQLEKFEDAKARYEAAFNLDAQNVRALQGLAACAVQVANYARAEEYLRQAIQADPRDSRLFYNLGVVLELLKRPEEAVTSYQTSLGRQSSFTPASVALGGLLLRLEKPEQAEKVLRTAALLTPEDKELVLQLAATYEELEEFDRALRTLEGVKDPAAQVDVRRRRAIILVKSGSADEGIQELKSVLSENDKDADTLGALGWAYLRERNLDEAEKYLRSAIAQDSTNAFAHNNLGVLLEQKGENEQAKLEFSRAKELDAMLPAARKNWERLGRVDH